MPMTMFAAQFRRIRIRSWKDVVFIVIAGLAVYGMQVVFQRKFGWDERKARNIAGLIILGLVIVFAIISVAAGN